MASGLLDTSVFIAREPVARWANSLTRSRFQWTGWANYSSVFWPPTTTRPERAGATRWHSLPIIVV
jgi:hypothetical protein